MCLNEGMKDWIMKKSARGCTSLSLETLQRSLMQLLSKRARREEASKERPAHLEALLSMEQNLLKADDGMSQKEGQQ